MAINQIEAERILTPYKDILSKCVFNACSDYFSLLAYVPHPIKSRTIATLIYDFIEAHAKKELDGLDGVQLLSIDGLFMAVLHDKVVLRFKKLNGNKMPSNIPTKQTLDYMNQQLDLPNMPLHASLIVGYELDRLKTKLQEVTITCPNGDKNLWSFNLHGAPGAEIIDLPFTPLQNVEDIPMRPKKKKETRGKEKANNA